MPATQLMHKVSVLEVLYVPATQFVCASTVVPRCNVKRSAPIKNKQEGKEGVNNSIQYTAFSFALHKLYIYQGPMSVSNDHTHTLAPMQNPAARYCCITLEPLPSLQNPVTFASDQKGAHPPVFELEHLLTWLSKRPVHPITREPILICDGFLIPVRSEARDARRRIRRFIHGENTGRCSLSSWLGSLS